MVSYKNFNIRIILQYDGINAGQAISTDEKAYMRNMIMSKDCGTTQAVLYPQVIPVVCSDYVFVS